MGAGKYREKEKQCQDARNVSKDGSVHALTLPLTFWNGNSVHDAWDSENVVATFGSVSGIAFFGSITDR